MYNTTCTYVFGKHVGHFVLSAAANEESNTRNQTQDGMYKWEMACTQAAMITTSEGSLVSGDSLGMTEAMYI